MQCLKNFKVNGVLYFYHTKFYILEKQDVRKRKITIKNDDNLKRKNRKTICFNNYEIQALNKYFKKYKIDNQSKLMREAILKSVLKKFSEDYPTLWDQPGISMQTSLSV